MTANNRESGHGVWATNAMRYFTSAPGDENKTKKNFMDTPSGRNISEVQCGVLKVMHGTEQRGITKRLPMQRMDHTSALR